jgi:hypothetical protein
VEYCLLRYVPNVTGREGVSIAAILIDVSDPDKEVCAITFAPNWQERVRLFDPASDLEMMAAIVNEIRDRMLSPTDNGGMLHQLEDSFSNVIQISERRQCPVPLAHGSVGAFAQELLEKTSTGFVGSSAMYSAACHL